MGDLSLTVVEGWHVREDDLELDDVQWSFALDQRHFGPRRLLVVTARADRTVSGVAYCGQTDPPVMGLRCCLHTLDDGASMAVAYSDEAVTSDPPPDLEERFEAARAAAGDYGIELVDWIMCDDLLFRSMRGTLRS